MAPSKDPRDPGGHLNRQFDKLDVNKDGSLSSDELFDGLLSAGWEQDEVSSLFDNIDANGDGKITKEEFLSYNWNRAPPGRFPTKALRLCSLAADGVTIEVKSVDMDINDDTFGDVGVCSYTWGHDRAKWVDAETGETWDTSSRSVAMARAALRHFRRVWVDGLCIVQCWDWHRTQNIAMMGRIYWHGTVLTESFMGMAPSYPLRGWVQQEIKFTKVRYHVKPIVDLLEAHCGGTTPTEALQAVGVNLVNAEVVAALPYLVQLQRILEGRRSAEAVALSEKVTMFIQKVNQFENMYGNVGPRELKELLEIGIPLTGSLPREDPGATLSPWMAEGVLRCALESYRAGWFTFNADRATASFSLASYVLKKDLAAVAASVDALAPEHTRGSVVVNPNPSAGRWCTGLGPGAQQLSTASAAETVGGKSWGPASCGKGVAAVDAVFSALLGEEALSALKSGKTSARGGGDYVVGWRVVADAGYSVHLGIRPSAGGGVCCLVSAFFGVWNEVGCPDKKGVLMEYGAKMTALLNASRSSHAIGGVNAALPDSPNYYRVLELANPLDDFVKHRAGGASDVQWTLSNGVYNVLQALLRGAELAGASRGWREPGGGGGRAEEAGRATLATWG